MKTKLTKLILGTALAVALGTNARAGFIAWDFDDWVNGPATNLVFAADPTTFFGSTWQQTFDGNPPAGGDPSTNGYLQLTPAVDGRNLAAVFPDIDNEAPIKAFKLTMDVRAGNPADADGRPADGFSISYVRNEDVALSNVVQYVDPSTLRGIVFGFAGGDSAAESQSPAGSSTAENGTKTGVSIVFDTWQGNTLPDTGAGGTPGPDVEGLAVRVDDKTLIQVPMPVRNADCANNQSLQTGDFLNDGGFSYTHLGWCRLEVEKTVDNKVNVTWKGRKILDGYQLAAYSPHRGHLLLAGRTGGNNQYVHFDNVVLETTPAIEPLVKSLTVNTDLRGWTFILEDFPPSLATNVTQVLWNGANVIGSVNVSKAGGDTTVAYTQAARLPANSTNQVRVTVQSSLGQTVELIANVTTPDHFVMPLAYALPLSAVSSQPRGIVLGQAWQTVAENRNSQGDNKLNWTEEQILGLRGTNLATVPSPASTDVVDFQNGGPTGNFREGGSLLAPPLWDGADYPLQATFGIGLNPEKGNTDDGAIEWFAYVHFPTAGEYTMVVNSDDGFRLSTARNAKDRLGNVISSFNAGRGAGTGAGAGTQQRVIVDQPGVYPIRGLMFNRAGGFDVEWYTRDGTNLFLVNSNSTPQSLQAWQSASTTGSYVQSAIPVRSAVDVVADQSIQIKLANGSTTVNVGSIVLKVDGATVSPTITPGAPVTVAQAPIGPGGYWAPGSSHTIELAFTDSASTAYSYAWSFTAAPYRTLPTNLRTPIGSGDNAKRGFLVRAQHGDHSGGNVGNNNYATESDLAGLFGPNLADLTGVDANGNFVVTDWINWDRGANDGSGGENGNFRAGNGYPEAPLPGITPTSGGTGIAFENVSEGVQTYVEFPTAGYYQLGVNSDDSFKVTVAEGPPGPVLTISGAVNKPVGVLSMSLEEGEVPIGRASYGPASSPPLTPLTAPIIYLTPGGVDDPGPYPSCTGKIALYDRNGTALNGANNSGAKAKWVQDQGAVAGIFMTPGDLGNVFYAGGSRTDMNIPILTIKNSTDGELLRAIAATNGTITGTIQGDPRFVVGGFNDGRGASDTIMGILVPQAGVYPMRMIFHQAGGGGNCEFFSVLSNGKKVLLNDTAAGGLKTYQARTPQVKFNPPTLAGGMVTFTWTGTGILQQATSLTGSPGDWSDVSPQPSGNTYTVPTTGSGLFLRLRQP